MLRSRMKKEMDRIALLFSTSIEHDENIFYYDILVDLAHILTLQKSGYLKPHEAREIIKALKVIRDFGFNPNWNYEDIHEAIEAEVTKITKYGAKMHTGRSRNDEIATCLRMFARDHLLNIAEDIAELQKAILSLTKNDCIMPGFTHLQYAQPTRLSHHLIAYFDMLDRDFQRCIEAFRRVNLSPLGSAAFASSPYNYDRYFAANLLGFDGIVEHSEDSVATRDFLIESIFVATSLLMTLSRIAEEIILFSSEFNFIELPDEFSSTSSIMPQKKNPDIAELVRATAGRIIGNLTASLAIYKALPFSYNRDFQEMNSILYESLKKADLACQVMTGLLSKIKFKPEVMEKTAGTGFTAATQLADMLVIKYNVPFRLAHRIVGKLAMEGKTSPTAEDLKRVAMEYGIEIDVCESDIQNAVDLKKIVESRKNVGGTSTEEVKRMVSKREIRIVQNERKVKIFKDRIVKKLQALYKEIAELGVNFI